MLSHQLFQNVRLTRLKRLLRNACVGRPTGPKDYPLTVNLEREEVMEIAEVIDYAHPAIMAG